MNITSMGILGSINENDENNQKWIFSKISYISTAVYSQMCFSHEITIHKSYHTGAITNDGNGC